MVAPREEHLIQEALIYAGGLANRSKELNSVTAERNQYRSEAAEAGRQADKLTQRLSAMPKARQSHQSLDAGSSLDKDC